MPVSVIRASRSRHLHIALIMRFCVSAQSSPAVGSPKTPASRYAPVLARDPAFALLRVSPFRPGIEYCEEHCSEFVKDSVAGDVPVVVRPTDDLRVERLDQFGLFLPAVSLHRFSQLLSVPFNRLRTWLDLGYTSDRLPLTVSVSVMLSSRILLDLETQEFKSRFAFRHFQRMDDSCFALLQFQPHFFEPFRDDLPALLNHFSFFVQDYEVISVSHHFRRTQSPPLWELFADDCFHTVEGDVG